MTTTLAGLEHGLEPRFNRRNLAVGVVSSFVVLVIAAWVVGFSSLLGARTIEVQGVHTLTAQQVRSVAAIAPGTPLLRLDTAAVSRRIRALPDVGAVRVRTSYPSTVVITVVERVALGYVESGPRFVLVDKTGDAFRTVATRPRGLPLFALPTGAQARATGQAITNVSAVLPASLRAQIRSIQAFDPTSITLQLTDGRIVRWGADDRNLDKARILPTLLAQRGNQFDVTNPDQVIAR
ncbi:MAG: FtsQ-type POTRA domain-containing protein [Actinomycetota bacterium]|nr:FtsQ-type POTRA domain-containing protein [Actinomycetota bacterium]